MELIFNLPSIALIVIGVIVCFLGYKFFRLSLALIGAGVGYFLADFLFTNYAVIFSLDGNSTAHLVLTLVMAVGLGSVAYALYIKAAMVVAAIGIGYWVNSAYCAYTGKSDVKTMVITWLVGIGLGIILGFAIKGVQRWAIILFTAAGGAYMAAGNASRYMIVNDTVEKITLDIGKIVFPGLTGNAEVLLSGMLLLMLFTAGIIIQSRSRK